MGSRSDDISNQIPEKQKEEGHFRGFRHLFWPWLVPHTDAGCEGKLKCKCSVQDDTGLMGGTGLQGV